MRNILLAAVTAAAALATVPAIAGPGQSCFFSTQWTGWKAADDHTVYLSVSGSRIYRLDIANACPELSYPDARLITVDRTGSGSICSPLDWDLRVSEGHGFSTPCIVKGMTMLTPAEAAALPKALRP